MTDKGDLELKKRPTLTSCTLNLMATVLCFQSAGLCENFSVSPNLMSSSAIVFDPLTKLLPPRFNKISSLRLFPETLASKPFALSTAERGLADSSGSVVRPYVFLEIFSGDCGGVGCSR